jgi:hypothetical protein
MKEEEFVDFWVSSSPFSNWYLSSFEIKGISLNYIE